MGLFDEIGDTFFGGAQQDAADEVQKSSRLQRDVSRQATQQALGLQRDALSQNLALQDPYIQGGGYAYQSMLQAMGLPQYDPRDRIFSPRVGQFGGPGFLGENTPDAYSEEAILARNPDFVPGDARQEFERLVRSGNWGPQSDLSGTNQQNRQQTAGRLRELLSQYPGLRGVDMPGGIDPALYQGVPEGGGQAGGQGILGQMRGVGQMGPGGGGITTPTPVGGGMTFDQEGNVLSTQGEGEAPADDRILGREAMLGRMAEGRQGDPYGGFLESPSYDFRLDEGLKAVERANAASGLLGSGAHMKDMTRYAQDLASTEFGDYFNRLAALSGRQQVQGAGSQIQNAGTNLANTATQGARSIGQGLMTAGQARASGILGATESRGNTIGTLASLAMMAGGGGFGGGGGGGSSFGSGFGSAGSSSGFISNMPIR